MKKLNKVLGKLIKPKRSSRRKKMSKHCPVCQSDVNEFEKLDDYYWKKLDENQCIHSPFTLETLNWLEYACPHCKAADRNRLYALYIEKVRDKLPEHLSILDFAPASQLQNFLIDLPGVEYRSADLLMEEVDDNCDIQNMRIYPDENFDFFICSHVLEHVDDDLLALQELRRVLKEDGRGIVMVPISLTLEETMEFDEDLSDEDRWKYYGQDDHLRFYAKSSFTKRLKEAGFKVQEHGEKYFGKSVFQKHGIHPRSILYIVTKS
jgi:SAM-dependent methyltransferase